MAASEVMELVVRVSPEGAEDAEAALEDVEDTFEQTADTAEESAEELDQWSRKWRGAMNIIVASLAIASAALLTQIPVVSDLMDGFRAILESIALKIDEAVRPALQGVVDSLFDLAIAIDQLEEPLATLVGTLGALIVVLAPLAAALRLFGLLGPAIRLLTRFAGPIGALIGLVSLLWSAWQTNFGGIREVTRDTMGAVQEFIGENLAFIMEDIEEWTQITAEWWGEWGDEVEEVARFAFDAIAQVVLIVLDTLFTAFTVWTQLVQGDWQDAWDVIEAWATRRLESLMAFIKRWGPRFVDFLRWLGGQIAAAITGRLRKELNELRGWLRDLERSARRAGISLDLDVIPRLQEGGLVTQTGLAMVHAGEQVVPAAQVQQGGGAGGGNNVFAHRQEMVIRFEPSEFERFVSAKLEDGTANTGRGASSVE